MLLSSFGAITSPAFAASTDELLESKGLTIRSCNQYGVSKIEFWDNRGDVCVRGTDRYPTGFYFMNENRQLIRTDDVDETKVKDPAPPKNDPQTSPSQEPSLSSVSQETMQIMTINGLTPMDCGFGTASLWKSGRVAGCFRPTTEFPASDIYFITDDLQIVKRGANKRPSVPTAPQYPGYPATYQQPQPQQHYPQQPQQPAPGQFQGGYIQSNNSVFRNGSNDFNTVKPVSVQAVQKKFEALV
ncbi:hypothetical protein HC766_05495 [Candidatus Gracilibacteria bacterium]|nr:hypothetical protein [Candidatus Gracilibacteria bacterium]